MENEIWRRPRWMKHLAREIHPLRDRELRQHTTNVYKAIQKKIRNPNVSALPTHYMEKEIVDQCRKMCARYQLLIAEIAVDSVSQERIKIKTLVSELLEHAHRHVVRDIEQQEKLEFIMSDFARLSWPGLT